MARTCFMFGHRNVGEDIFPALEEAIERHYTQHGVRNFIVGRYGSFDRMAANAVREIKKSYPEIRLTLLCPYHPATRQSKLPEGFDSAWYPFDKAVPQRLAIILANEKAIEMCDYLIAYVNRPGKSRDFLELAIRKEKKGLIGVTDIG